MAKIDAKDFSEFIKQWSIEVREKGHTQSFWLGLLHILGVENVTQYIDFEMPVRHDAKGNDLYIDAYIPSMHVLIEQKSSHIPLDSTYQRHNTTYHSVYEQAEDYNQTFAKNESADYIITCNFHEFWIYDMNVSEKDRQPIKLALTDLPKQYKQLNFLIDPNWHVKPTTEVEVSVKAGELVGELYDAMLKLYKNPQDKHSLYSLNVFCVRIVFCLYAEDSGLFGEKDAFQRYLEGWQWQNSRTALIELFRVLDTPTDQRDPYLKPDLAAFPYVNGGLFHDENIEIPLLTEEIFHIICDDMSAGFDWHTISPTIFGAVFESTLNPETRRAGGMHYTSIENIHKVIDPLFLHDLRAELEKILAWPENEKFNQNTKFIKKLKVNYERALEGFQAKIASLKFFDPACGSGNFLTETYLSLRRLENKVIRELSAEYVVLGEVENPIKVSISQFYGIEINDFAVTVAKTALWIAESQMMQETEHIVNMQLDFLPLKTNANIVEGNALRLDWKKIVAPNELSYIMGNPPFVGFKYASDSQKDDMQYVFAGDIKTALLDYVCCWYKKAADYMQGNNVQTAFVSTNSVSQGQMAGDLWNYLINEKKISINFAYRTFVWNSDSTKKAHVHVVVIGFANYSAKEKYIYSSHEKTLAENINPYLIDAPNIVVTKRRKPLCDVPEIIMGNQAMDKGNLIIEEKDYESFIKQEPKAIPYIKRYMMGNEFINGKKRYCLWLVGVSPRELRNMPLVMKRVEAVRAFRSASHDPGARKKADTPTLFREQRNPKHFIAIPITSSQNREYIPIGYLDDKTIAGNTLFILPEGTLYQFGVLTSNVHMSWMRTVGARLKSDYRYSKDIVYNTFPWCNPTEVQRQKIEQTAQGILDARALYPNDSLVDLYDETTMPPELRKAHRANDKAVMQAYGFDAHMSEANIVAALMKMYQQLIAEKNS